MPRRRRDPVFVLIHSPVVGPTTWSPVARELARRGREAVVPRSWVSLRRNRRSSVTYRTPCAPPPRIRRTPIVLAGHSGGGLLLPVIADDLTAEVAALVFVDSFLPPPSGTLRLAPPGFMDQLRALATDGVLPPWSSWLGEDALRELVADDRLRGAMEEEMPRLPLSYFDASVPLPDGWDACPCAYILLTGPYRGSGADARARGWLVAEIPGVQHLAMATEPITVTDTLVELERTLVGSA